MKDRNYALCFRGRVGESAKYTGRVLGVGISYDKKSKKHACKVEVLSEGMCSELRERRKAR